MYEPADEPRHYKRCLVALSHSDTPDDQRRWAADSDRPRLWLATATLGHGWHRH